MFKKETMFNNSIYKKNGMCYRCLGSKNIHTKSGFMHSKMGHHSMKDILENMSPKKHNALEKM
jgi:hypothetical protein